MARLADFERELRVATAGLEPAAVSRYLAESARKALRNVQASGEAPLSYEVIVNGVRGASEDSVKPPGPIIYDFSWLPEVAEYGLAFCEARSPVLSGRYKKSWFVLVNGSLWSGGFIPPDAELIITNDQPYSRKIEIGTIHVRVPPGIVESARQALMRRFGNIITVERRFIALAGAYQTRKGELTYPALVIQQRY